ncbi:hypothetical protein [Acidianus sp. RZ1]|uniref:hypothetical protein n=1 Tax=Acidianus sp. RZ1 TaxID=1540082 RepID=UPI001491C141|nr:hypothetical protein [Acidianus sp. RZ1]NON63075.1 hypothetical protein [Acidianus sp. RZ1]
MEIKLQGNELYEDNVQVATLTVKGKRLEITGNLNLVLNRNRILQDDNVIGEIDSNEYIEVYGRRYFVGKPQLIAYHRGYSNEVKLYENGSEVSTIKSQEDGSLVAQVSYADSLIPTLAVMLIMTSIGVSPYRKPNRGRSAYRRQLLLIYPILLLFLLLLPFNIFIDLAIYIAITVLIYIISRRKVTKIQDLFEPITGYS